MKRFLLVFICMFAFVVSLFSATAKIENFWLEHNVTRDGEKGLVVHAKIYFTGVLNHSMHIDAYFDSPAGYGITDINGRYRASNGVVACVMNVDNRYDNGHLDDLQMFIPYSELHQEYDNPDMACHIFVHDETLGSILARSEFVSFSYTTGRQRPSDTDRYANNNNVGNGAYKEVRNTGFGEETWCHNPDGSAMVITKRTCVSCHGGCVCPICHGTQGRWANGMWYGCSYCAGLNGMCKACHGKGYTVSTTFVNSLGAAITYGEYGGVYLGAGGNVRDDGHGNKVETRRNKAGEPIDLIQYNVPNYTGEAMVQWCDRCGKWGSPHTHKIVR